MDKLYTDDAVKRIGALLELPQPMLPQLHDLLEKAASEFLFNVSVQSRLTKKQTDPKFKQLANYMQKTGKLFDEVTKNSLSGVSDLGRGIFSLDKENPHKERLYDLYHSHEYFTTTENISSLFYTLEEVFLKASDPNNKGHLTSWDKTEQVLSWLCRIAEFWEVNSKVKISEGKHTVLEAESDDEEDVKTGNDSPALRILMLMAQPLNEQIEHWKITNSMLTQAIRKRRNPEMVSKVDYITDEEADELFDL